MDTTTSALLTGVVVTAGRYAQDKPLDAKVALGAGFLAIGLAVLGQINPKLAQSFGTLILVASLLNYAIPISKKAGFTK